MSKELSRGLDEDEEALVVPGSEFGMQANAFEFVEQLLELLEGLVLICSAMERSTRPGQYVESFPNL